MDAGALRPSSWFFQWYDVGRHTPSLSATACALSCRVQSSITPVGFKDSGYPPCQYDLRHIAPALGGTPFGGVAVVAVRLTRRGDAAWRARHARCAAVPQLAGLAREGGGLLLDLHHADGANRSLRVQPRIASNNQLSIQQRCESGLGLALLGSVDVQDALTSGRLVRLLPQWAFGTLDIWAVTPRPSATCSRPRCARPLQRCTATWSRSLRCWSRQRNSLSGWPGGVLLPARSAPAAGRG